MPNKIIVQIIQPVVPTYRVPLFESLLADDRFEVHLMAAKDEPHGVKSVKTFHPNIDLDHDILVFFKKIMWQKHLKLLPQMKQGDVLIINGNVKFLSNYPLIMEAKKRKVAVVWWGHGWSSTSTKLSFYFRLKIMKIADRFLLYTEREKLMLVENGFDDESVHFMNNTIYTNSIFKQKKLIDAEQIEVFKEKNKTTNKRVLLFSGRLKAYPKILLEVALGALRILNSSDDKYVLIIIGDGSEKEKLQELVQKLDLNTDVLFLGAIYDEAKLAPWFMTAGCSVFPGAVGLSLLHSFAYGVPVVTHDKLNEHGPEIAALQDRKNGLLFKKNDDFDLANKIRDIFSDLPFFKDNAYQTITGEYSYDNLIHRVKDCILDASSFKRG